MVRTYDPGAELDKALERGSLSTAIDLAAEIARNRGGRPVGLSTAARFLPLVAAQRPHSEYEAFALRWLVRWITETPDATLAGAGDVVDALADLDIGTFETIRSGLPRGI